ncbi:MAG: NAD(P)/FAD-dependent oxidoreductase [Rhodobacterales bacterium]
MPHRSGRGSTSPARNGLGMRACAMLPVTAPGLIQKAPGMLLDPNAPLFLKWAYLPRLMPWLLKYLSNANSADTRRIADGLSPLVADSVDQHMALTDGLAARSFVTPGDYVYAYANRADFDSEARSWGLRAEHGFLPEVIEGDAVRDYEPTLGPSISCLAVLRDHGHVRDPGGYVKALARDFVAMGGVIRQTDVQDVTLTDGRITALLTRDGAIPCSRAVIAGGVWSGPLMQKLGLKVPMESERGYHIVFTGAQNGPRVPFMIQAGKFVATPMDAGLRCAGIIEFGGLDAAPSRAPFDLLRRQVKRAFPGLTHGQEVEWMGHRPAPSDSLPLIGQIRDTGVYTAFGHHHIGLTAGPKTGRLLAGLLTGRPSNTDLTPYRPGRFA